MPPLDFINTQSRPEIKALVTFGAYLLVCLLFSAVASSLTPIPSGVDAVTGKPVTHTPFEYLVIAWKLARINIVTLLFYPVSALIAFLLASYKIDYFSEPKRSQVNSLVLALLTLPGVLMNPHGGSCPIVPTVILIIYPPVLVLEIVPFLAGWLLIFTCFVVWRCYHPISEDAELSRA